MRRLIFSLLLAATCVHAAPAHAAAGDSATSDATEKDALAAIVVKLAAETNFDRHFVQQKKLKILARPIRTEGTLLYRQNRGVCWATTAPVQSVLVLTEDSIRQSAGGSSNVVTAEQQPALFGFTKLFFAALSGQVDALRDRFDIQLKNGADHSQSGTGNWTLQLQPRDSFLQKIIGQMDLQGRDQLDRVVMHGRDGDITEIEFSAVSQRDAQLEQRCFAD